MDALAYTLPWSKQVIWTTVTISALLLMLIGLALFSDLRTREPWAFWLVIGVCSTVFIAGVVFAPYKVSIVKQPSPAIRVHYPLHTRDIKLTPFSTVQPVALKDLGTYRRTHGNEGFFALTGKYESDKIGAFWLISRGSQQSTIIHRGEDRKIVLGIPLTSELERAISGSTSRRKVN